MDQKKYFIFGVHFPPLALMNAHKIKQSECILVNLNALDMEALCGQRFQDLIFIDGSSFEVDQDLTCSYDGTDLTLKRSGKDIGKYEQYYHFKDFYNYSQEVTSQLNELQEQLDRMPGESKIYSMLKDLYDQYTIRLIQYQVLGMPTIGRAQGIKDNMHRLLMMK